MSVRQSNSQKWSEQDVESLLFDFFRDEMPRDLPPPRSCSASPVKQSTAATSTNVPQRKRTAGYQGLGLAACALLLAVTALSTTGRRWVAPEADESDPDVPAFAAPQPDESPITARKPTLKQYSGRSVAGRTTPLPAADERSRLIQLIPELRLPADNASNVGFPEDGDDLHSDFEERLGIKLFELEDDADLPGHPGPAGRPRLPEER